MLATLACLISTAIPAQMSPILGGDCSEIPEVEAMGAQYKVDGKAIDPLVAMKQAGWTAVRLRLWNDPKNHYCDLPHTVALAKRITGAGLTFMLDFHYSDWWADPGKQNKPAAWAKLSQEDLNKAIHDYSRDVLKTLDDAGAPPAIVQVGNEVTNGILWPESRLNLNGDGWDNFMALTKSAIAGVREGAGQHQPKIMVHIDQGGRNNVSRFFFDQYFARGGEADIIGLSYYPFWHGTLQMLKENLADLSNTYHKDILIAETAYPTKGWNPKTRQPDDNYSPDARFKSTKEGQNGYIHELMNVVKSTPDGHGLGILWWAPTWLGRPGQQGGWNQYLLFDPQTGEANPAFFAFKQF